jgi:hypothetical protein
MVERKKVTCAERLQDVRAAMASAEQKVQARKASMRTAQGTDIVTNVEVSISRGVWQSKQCLQFRNYVNKLRAKTNDYKKKRAALLDMRAEGGVLARTNELLSQQRDELKMQLVHKHGLLLTLGLYRNHKACNSRTASTLLVCNGRKRPNRIQRMWTNSSKWCRVSRTS